LRRRPRASTAIGARDARARIVASVTGVAVIYFKSFVAGLVAALLLAIVVLVVYVEWITWDYRGGSGSVSVCVDVLVWPAILAAVVGFALGFFWQFRRSGGA
jgi:hypothetical protein